MTSGVVALAVLAALVAVADHAPDGGGPVGSVSTAAVQGGGARGFRKSQIDPAVVLAAQQAETRVLRDQDRGTAPSLVLWPEDVVSLGTPLPDSPEEAELAALARALRTTLVVGVTETVSASSFRNEIVAWGPDGTPGGPVREGPPGPLRRVRPLPGLLLPSGRPVEPCPLDAVPGTGSGLLHTPAAPSGPWSPMRCSTPTGAGPRYGAAPSCSSSPPTPPPTPRPRSPPRRSPPPRVQAVQQGRDLLQAAPTGYSAAITNRGTAARAFGPRGAPAGPGRPGPAGGIDGLRPLRRPPAAGPGRGGPRRRMVPGRTPAPPRRLTRATRSSPSGCRRRGCPSAWNMARLLGSSSNASRRSNP